jgi:hypothetical protein
MTLATWMMSFSLSVRNSPSFQSSGAPLSFRLPRNPASFVRAMPEILPVGRASAEGEFERGRGAVCFRIPGVERHVREELVGQPDHWVETAEGVAAIDIGACAQQIRRDDSGEVVTRACGQRQPRGDVERLTAVEAVIRILGIETHRAEAKIRGGVDNLSRPRHGGIGSDEQVGEDVAKFAAGLEADVAVVDAAADGDIIVVAEDLVVVGGLQRSAGGERVGPRAVDRPPRRGGAGVAAARGGN